MSASRKLITRFHNVMMNKVSGFRKYGHNLGPLDGMGIHWGGGGGGILEGI